MIINEISTELKKKYNKYLSQNGCLFLINKKNITYNSNIILKKVKMRQFIPLLKQMLMEWEF